MRVKCIVKDLTNGIGFIKILFHDICIWLQFDIWIIPSIMCHCSRKIGYRNKSSMAICSYKYIYYIYIYQTCSCVFLSWLLCCLQPHQALINHAQVWQKCLASKLDRINHEIVIEERPASKQVATTVSPLQRVANKCNLIKMHLSDLCTALLWCLFVVVDIQSSSTSSAWIIEWTSSIQWLLTSVLPKAANHRKHIISTHWLLVVLVIIFKV